MKNRRLEDRIKKRGNEFTEIISLIERCEDGNVVEIKLEKSEGITDSPVIDKMIITYLQKLKVKVSYISEKNSSGKPELKSKIKKPSCDNKLHSVVNGKMKKSPKMKTINKNKWLMFKIDATTFVSCPKCFHILEVK